MWSIDYDKRLLVLSVDALNKKPKDLFLNKKIDFYSIIPENVCGKVRDNFIPLKKRGYSMVLKHENLSLLLCFNRA